jgi:hypothetical protein
MRPNSATNHSIIYSHYLTTGVSCARPRRLAGNFNVREVSSIQ